MAIPALPADDSAGNSWTAAKVNAIYDHLELHRDNKPILAVRNSGAQTLTSGSDTNIDYSGTPDINVGSWSDTSTTYNGWKVPEIGVYQVFAWIEFQAGNTGYRQASIYLNNTIQGGTRVRLIPTGASAITSFTTVGFVWASSAGDEIHIKGLHTQTTDLTVDSYLRAVWLNSAIS